MVKLSKVKRELVLDFGDDVKVIAEVYQLTPALSDRLGEKQRLIGNLQKQFQALIDDTKLDEIEKGINAQKHLETIYNIYIDIFKLCVVDYSVIEKEISEIPYTSMDTLVAILQEINYEMTKVKNGSLEKKN